MLKKISIFVLLLNISCSSVHIKYKTKPLELNTYRVHNIELRDHQVKPVEYLFRTQEQKGLLLNHYLGTGKTYTSLAFCEKYPHKKIIILAPRFLRSNWQSHIDKMGIKNKKRYRFISYQKAPVLLKNIDLKNTILIIDEVHRLVERIKSKDENTREKFSKLYHHLRTAYKILALTGTPIFTEISDISYLLNLVSGQDLLPYNQRIFLDRFTKIKKLHSFWRGHFSESNIMMLGVPFVLSSIPLAFITPDTALVAGVFVGGFAAALGVLPLINALTPIEKNSMRIFEPSNISELAMQYVSYYDFRQEKSDDYPSQSFKNIQVNYNEEQTNFMIQFADMALDHNQLARLAKEDFYNIKGDLKVESSAIQKQLNDWPDSGREIGNLSFTKNNEIIEPPKFEAIWQEIAKDPQGIVIYSSYFKNGGLAFAEFLDRKGMTEKYKVLDPQLPTNEQTRIVDGYNIGTTPILILHPDYTEGISLEGTRQLHILEPLPSQALNEQIIGRVIRFHSHHRLPKEKRHVTVYNWKSTLGFVLEFLHKNKNWAKRFSELNSLSSFGVGLSKIDPNFNRKKMSPDDFTDLKRASLKTSMKALENVFRSYSIEGNIKMQRSLKK